MNIEDKLLEKKKAIDIELERILCRGNSLLFEAMRYAVLDGGKRFRPLLALNSGECFGVTQDVVLPFACAIELLHNYSLIHDDLPSMDNDDFRRGKPSCHKAYGEDIALLAGDGLLTLAFEVVAKARMKEDSYSKKEIISQELSQRAGVEGMIGGQLIDITLSPEKISEKEMYELILKKTGALIIASVRIGAFLGDASPSQIEAMTEYGRNLGLAFQVRDDILDSVEDTVQNGVSRPNTVTLFSLEGAKERLKAFIEKAVNSLNEASLESEGLRYLAEMLLSLKGK